MMLDGVGIGPLAIIFNTPGATLLNCYTYRTEQFNSSAKTSFKASFIKIIHLAKHLALFGSKGHLSGKMAFFSLRIPYGCKQMRKNQNY